MKKLFLIFIVLFTCALPVSGFGDVVTNNRKEFDQFTNRLQDQFTSFTSNLKQYGTDFQTRNQQEYADFQARSQQKFADFETRSQQKFADFETRSQQEISNFRKRSDDKIAEIKRKSAEAFEKLEQAYNDFIKGTPFENCIPGWSYLECKQVNNLSKSTWSCKLKSGITAQKMSSDVEAYCATKTNAFEYDPLEDFEEPENEVNAHDEHDQSQDSQGAPFAPAQNNAWNTNYEDSDETPDSAPSPTQDKSASAMIAQEATRKAEKNTETCTLAQRDKINATDCKISADGKYSDIVCKNGYTKNTDETKCVKKSDTPDKKPELIKISGIVIDATSKDEQTIGGVRIKYDEGKKDKDGTKKYAQHQTGNNGRFAINIVPGSTITFTHKMYHEITTESYSAETKDVKIEMSPTDETLQDRNRQKLCEENKKGTWNKTKKECNCKGKNTIFNEQKGCVGAEEFKFEGVVKDTKGNLIPDVKVKYGNQSTTTDAQGKFTLNAPKDTEITFSYKGYKNQTYTLTADTINQTITMEPTDKAANNAEKQKLCEKDGKGEWKPKLNKCNCKGKAFFDEDEGCVESTQEYTNAEKALNDLYEQFKAQLETIKG